MSSPHISLEDRVKAQELIFRMSGSPQHECQFHKEEIRENHYLCLLCGRQFRLVKNSVLRRRALLPR